jgi:hypothetical protein
MPFWATSLTACDSTPTQNRSGFHLIRATTMTATLPVNSVWTRKTKRLCRLLSRHPPLVASSCQLVVASPLVVLSLCYPLVVLSHQLVVALPLAIVSLRHPLVLLLCQLVVTLPILILLLCHPLVLSSRRLVVVSPVDAAPSRCLIVSSSRHLVISSSHRLPVLPSRHIIRPADCHIISHHPLVVPPSCLLIVPAVRSRLTWKGLTSM